MPEPDPWGSYLTIWYTNNTDRKIEAVKFNVSFGDILIDTAPSVWSYSDERGVKPGKSRAASWGDGVYTHQLSKGIKAEATISKVVFADGTAWEGDCKM